MREREDELTIEINSLRERKEILMLAEWLTRIGVG